MIVTYDGLCGWGWYCQCGEFNDGFDTYTDAENDSIDHDCDEGPHE